MAQNSSTLLVGGAALLIGALALTRTSKKKPSKEQSGLEGSFTPPKRPPNRIVPPRVTPPNRVKVALPIERLKDLDWTPETDKVVKREIRRIYQERGSPPLTQIDLFFSIAVQTAQEIFPEAPWPVGGSPNPGAPGYFIFEDWMDKYGRTGQALEGHRDDTGWRVLQRIIALAEEELERPGEHVIF